MNRAQRSGLTAALLMVAGLSAGWSSSVSAQSEEVKAVQSWLDRMSLAIDGLTYQGTLVYTRGPRIDALRIFHSVTDAGTRERLVSLTGSPREVLRDHESVRCIFPDSQSVLIDTRIAERLFPTIPPQHVANPEGRYRFSISGKDRIAQLSATVINIVPRDAYRYGYRLWLEDNTGMLLKSMLLDTAGRPLEQLMFTDIEIGGPISESDLIPDVPDSGFVQVDIPQSVDKPEPDDGQGHWQVDDLPIGFMKSGHSFSPEGDARQMEHLIFTDGLASVSVYVEAADGKTPPLSGATRVGAVSMFGLSVDGHTVTAVGEVPAATLRKIANSVRPASLAAR